MGKGLAIFCECISCIKKSIVYKSIPQLFIVLCIIVNTALITARCIFETYHAFAYAKYAEHVLLITRFQLLIPSYTPGTIY